LEYQKKTLTVAGYVELQTSPLFKDLCSLEKNFYLFQVNSKIKTSDLEETISVLIKQYEENCSSQAENPQAILEAIVIFCRQMVLIHPFSDCNGRIFCNVFLNRELIKHGFSPAFLQNPNCIDGHSIKESVSELIRGMDSFQKIKHEPVFNSGRTTDFLQTQQYPIHKILLLIDEQKARDSQAAFKQELAARVTTEHTTPHNTHRKNT